MASELVRARESFGFTDNEGREVVVRVGDIVEATHPIAKQHSALFESLAPVARHESTEGQR